MMHRLIDIQSRPQVNPKRSRRVCFKCRDRVASIGDMCEPCIDSIGESVRAELGAKELVDDEPKRTKAPESSPIEVWEYNGSLREVISRNGIVTYRTGKRRLLRTATAYVFDMWVRENGARRVG